MKKFSKRVVFLQSDIDGFFLFSNIISISVTKTHTQISDHAHREMLKYSLHIIKWWFSEYFLISGMENGILHMYVDKIESYIEI